MDVSKFPITIEFLGMPNAGKTTAVEIAESCLKQEGKRVRIIYEGARISPLDKSDRFMYNAWSFHNTINRILEARLNHYDYILIDRGVYDHFAFLGAIREQCPQKEFDATYRYYDNFTELIDMGLLFMILPNKVIKREKKHNPYQGRVINQEFLERLYQSYKSLDTYHPLSCLGITLIEGNNSISDNNQTVLEIIKSQTQTLERRCG